MHDAQSRRTHATRSWTYAALSLGLYFLGTLYLLARVLPHFRSAIPGGAVATIDGWQNTWNMWWTHLALTRGQNPYVTDMLFFPAGQSLYLHTLNITNALLTMPMQLVGGPLAAYNTALILGFVLTGFATYLLALYIIGHRGIACAVGALATFNPFHVAKLFDGHLSWVTVFWIPLFLLCTLHALDSSSRRWSILASIVLAAATWTSYYYLIFSFLFTCLLLLVRFPSAIREQRWRSELTSAVLIGGLAGVLMSPLVIPALREYRAETRAAQAMPAVPSRPEPVEDPGWDRETATYSADLVDMFWPSPFQPWWGSWADQRHQTMHYGWFWTIAPGYGVLALAAIGTYVAGRRARVWAILVAVLWILMLGPRLRVAGVVTGVVLPFELLRVVPGMTLGHRPNHLAIFMLPLLMILAGFGMQVLLQRGRGGQLALGLLGTMIVIEMMVRPMPALAFNVDPAVYQLRGQPGGVMDLPTLQRNAPSMVNQMAHGRPIMGGYLARPPATTPLVDGVPWVRQLWWLKLEPSPEIIVQRPDDGQQALNFYNVRTIIVRRNDLKPPEVGRLAQVMAQVLPGSKPTAHGPSIDVYTIEPVAATRPFLFLGTTGWYPREQQGDLVWRWMSAGAAMQVVNPEQAPRAVTLEFSVLSYQQPRPLEVSLDSQAVASYQITPAQQTIRLQLTLP
ncbi:MAG: hypothetical protein H0X37_19685, partial [Herpetosiphonaceae bacterium]|nr:hypothetical protein [Herpetosiphonaceae bacterium]